MDNEKRRCIPVMSHQERRSFVNPRWVQVLQGVVSGMQAEEITAEYGIHRKEIQRYKTNMAKAMGESDLHKGLVKAVIYGVQHDIVTVTPDRENILAEKEKELLQLLIDGKSNQEIAEALGITLKAVGGRTTLLYCQIGAGTRYSAIAEGVALGMQPTPQWQ